MTSRKYWTQSYIIIMLCIIYVIYYIMLCCAKTKKQDFLLWAIRPDVIIYFFYPALKVMEFNVITQSVAI